MNRKLDDIEKKNIYKVPEGYFNELPGIIQAKAIEKEMRRTFEWSVPAIKYAIPAFLVVILAGYYAFFNAAGTQPQTTAEILAEIETEELVEFLAMSEITTDEILESVTLNEIDFVFEDSEVDLLNNSDLSDLDHMMDDFLDINEL